MTAARCKRRLESALSSVRASFSAPDGGGAAAAASSRLCPRPCCRHVASHSRSQSPSLPPPRALLLPPVTVLTASRPQTLSGVFRLPRRGLFGLSSAACPPIKQQIRRRLPFPPSAFYSVVLDVPSYHRFLPYCRQSALLASTPATHSFSARLTLGFSSFNEQYTSLVSYSDPASAPPQQLYRVHARSLDCALFRHLSSTWEIRPVEGRPAECDVLFDIEMSLSSPLHRAVVSRVFANVAQQQLDAFVQRAQQLMSAAVHHRAAQRQASDAAANNSTAHAENSAAPQT